MEFVFLASSPLGSGGNILLNPCILCMVNNCGHEFMLILIPFTFGLELRIGNCDFATRDAVKGGKGEKEPSVMWSK